MDRDRVIELVEVEILRHEQMEKLKDGHMEVADALREMLEVFCNA